MRNIWRLYGGWWDGDPSHLKPARARVLALEMASMAGGARRLADRETEHAEGGDLALACHLAETAWLAAPGDRGIAGVRTAVYTQRVRAETSVLMARGVFSAAARRDSRGGRDMTTRYEGGCHCSAVRFHVDVEDHQALTLQLLDVREDGLPPRHRAARALRHPPAGRMRSRSTASTRAWRSTCSARRAACTRSTARARTRTTGTSTRCASTTAPRLASAWRRTTGRTGEAHVADIRDRHP